MSVLSGYLDADQEPTGPALAGAAGCFRTAPAVDGIHDEIAARATEAAESAPDDTAIVDFAGRLRFDDYFVTRVVAPVLHGVDLRLARGLGVEVATTALAVVNPFLLESADRADPLALALALTGRVQAFPCNVLGYVSATTHPGSPLGGALSPYAGCRPTTGEETCSSP